MIIESSLDLWLVLFRNYKKSLRLSCRETFIYCLDNVRALHPVHVWSTWSLIHTFLLYFTQFDTVYVQFVHIHVSVKLNRIWYPINPTTTYLTDIVTIKHRWMHSHLQELSVTYSGLFNTSNNKSAYTSQIDWLLFSLDIKLKLLFSKSLSVNNTIWHSLYLRNVKFVKRVKSVF